MSQCGRSRRHLLPSRLQLGVTLVCAVLTGCGSSSASPSATPSRPSEVSKSQAQIIADAAAAISAAPSYHMSGQLNDGRISGVIDFTVSSSDVLKGSLHSDLYDLQFVDYHGVSYERGSVVTNAAAGPQFLAPGNSWVELAKPSFAGLLADLAPSKLGACLVTDASAPLTKSLTTTLDGTPSIEFASAAGWAFDVAAAGRPYLLSIAGSTASSGSASGGACNLLGSGVFEFDSWGSPVTVTPPPNPVSLPSA